MSTGGQTGGGAQANSSTVALFQEQWSLYRKVVDNNLLFHREAYGRLRRFLEEEVKRPFRFLDIACGDATCSAQALLGTQVRHYRGIDFSAPALALAAETLDELGCEAILEQSDILDGLADRSNLADVAWIGLSLHHFPTSQKRVFMHTIRRALPADGMLLIYENLSREGEPRSSWLNRWDAQFSSWTALSPAEWRAITAHVHAADFPEPDSTWRMLGYDAGFPKARRLYVCPTALFGLYCFSA